MKHPRSGFCLTLLLMLLFTAFFVAGCSSSGSDTSDPGGGTVTPPVASAVPASFSLSLTQTSVQSDNSDSSTVTATVLDSSLAPVSGATVTFSASAGVISASSVQTEANGQASIIFSSGTAERANQTVTITATVAGLTPRQIPIQIIGTTVSLSSTSTNLVVPAPAIATLTISVRDAAAIGIFDVPVTVSINPASTGAVLLSSGATSNVTTLEANTDVSGVLTVVVTGTGAAGSVIVNVASQGATASITYTVAVAGSAFGITSPAADPTSLATNTNLTITVNAPGLLTVLFSTTFGAWDGGASSAVVKAVAGGTASAVLRAAASGIATVQVFDPSVPTTFDTLTVVITAPPISATQIDLQASATVVAPSTGGTQNTVTLTATVKDGFDQVVGNAPVSFSILNPTGGGETLSPAIAFTNSSGAATATFTSGSLSSSAAGVTVTAGVVGTAITDTIVIVIGGTAGSIVIGQGTHIASIYTNTTYQLPMSVLVADSNGNPVVNAMVSLKLWPSWYSTGFWAAGSPPTLNVTGTFLNEDLNRNLILDPGEDLHNPGQLTPSSSDAGTLPSPVITDDAGVAEFNLTYPKNRAYWIAAEITASTLVLGTETQSVVEFFLPAVKADVDNSLVFDSPYGL